MDLLGVEYSDRFVYQALQSLIADRGDNAIITHEDVSSKAGTCYRTTRRALQRLAASGMIKRRHNVGIGYQYSIPDITVPRRRT